MWFELPIRERKEYKKMILAFASLTEIFAQKAESDEHIVPIINSKYQETIFQKAFQASAEDIGNTSYDAAIRQVRADGSIKKYLIGIKTFGYGSGAQKIAQFKAMQGDWLDILTEIKQNAKGHSKEEIDEINAPLYLKLATTIAELRNERIQSSEENLKGFSISEDEIENKDEVEAVYHVLMPAGKKETPAIYVGEMSYEKIDIPNIKILGCTSPRNPTNFDFTDGSHTYRFTSADSQLLMNFHNTDIVQEKWDVKYADKAYSIFSNIAKMVYPEIAAEENAIVAGKNAIAAEKNAEYQIKSSLPEIEESYSWYIPTDLDGEVQKFSGFNSFYGVGVKIQKSQRQKKINLLQEKYEYIANDSNNSSAFKSMIDDLQLYLLGFEHPNEKQKMEKVKIRRHIEELLQQINDNDLTGTVRKLIYRPAEEIYIPIPNSKSFHHNHPHFFYTCGAYGANDRTKNKGKKYSMEERSFNLIFEPSGKAIRSYITQDNGKAIESCKKQTYLGNWILRKVFQLKPYQPLTRKVLDNLLINGVRLYKEKGSDDIHLLFIYIDPDNPPEDLWE